MERRSDDAAPLVYVITLNWNRPDDTVRCVRSIWAADYPHCRVVIVDNGSTDDSAARFRAELPDADLLVNAENLGFAGGCNVGIQHAAAHGAELIFLLNNDTTIAPGLLTELVAVAAQDARIGMVGPSIYYMAAPDAVWFRGRNFRGSLYAWQRDLALAEPLPRVADVDIISGCGMLIKRAVWEEIGWFDPRFFMYWEDVDLCLRARRAGWRVVCAPRARMWHAVSVSTGGAFNPANQYMFVKSSLRFFRKHTQGLTLFANIAVKFAHTAWSALYRLGRGELSWQVIRWYLRGIWQGTSDRE